MGGIVSTIGFPIPKAEDAGGEFAKKMRTAEDALTSMFNDSLKKQKSKEVAKRTEPRIARPEQSEGCAL